MVLTPRMRREKAGDEERLEMSWPTPTAVEDPPPKESLAIAPVVSSRDGEFAEFVRKELSERECVSFIPAAKKPTHCSCGRAQEWHDERRVPLNPDAAARWDVATHTRMCQPSAFGRVVFTGYGSGGGRDAEATFVRVDERTPPSALWALLHQTHRLSPPKLLISVTGGAKALYMKPRLESAFKRGLMDVASTTDAWILSGGMAAGVMKLVGDAISEHRATGIADQHNIIAIGIAPWGCVDNSAALTSAPGEGKFPAEYNLRECTGEYGAPLDHNHTHFILVDNGTIGKYGTEIKLRADLESFISSKKSEEGVEIPIVLIVCEGGPNTVQQTWEALHKGIPAVIIKGSGRAADLIANCFKATRPKKNDENKSVYSANFDESCREQIAQYFGIKMDDEHRLYKVNRSLEHVKAILAHRELLTVFELSDASCRDMDKAVLSALLKAKSANPQSQVDLALIWGRADIARIHIFTLENRSRWQGVALEDAMEAALVRGSTDFAQLFLDNGVSLPAFLTPRRLRDLYRSGLASDTHITLILNHLLSLTKVYDRVFNFGCLGRIEPEKADDFLLIRMGNVVRYLLNDNFTPKYSSEAFVVTGGSESGAALDEPFNDLFLWAILLHRVELARMFWRTMRNPIGGALVGSRLLQSLAEEAERQEEVELAAELSKEAEAYETMACEVLSQCYALGKSASHLLLRREQRSWGSTTLLSLAESAQLMDFMQLSPCQTMLNQLWYGHLADYTQDWKIILVILCPPLIPLVRFKTKLEEKASKVLDMTLRSDEPPPPETGRRRSEAPKKRFRVGWCGLGEFSIFSAWYRFYTAPVTTFYVGTLFYVVFLGILSVVSLTRLEAVSTWSWSVCLEVTLWAWTGTMGMEELRAIGTREAKSVGFKLWNHFSLFWNQLQAAFTALVVATVALRVRGVEEEQHVARVLYAFAVLLAYLRFMEAFYVSKAIGPKIIMIQRMLKDLGMFLAILMVFVLSFGIAMQSLLHPESTFSPSLLKDAVYIPYWQIFGELFLERSEGATEDACRPLHGANGSHFAANSTLPTCPQKTFLVPLLQSVYMMLTNVLLLNLLIAMFSYTFQNVQDKSEKVWRFYRYTVVRKYFNAPALPPPLVFLPHAKRLAYFIHNYAMNKRLNFSNPFKMKLSLAEDERLAAFEKAGRELHLASSQRRSLALLDSKMADTKTRLDKVVEELEDIREQLVDGAADAAAPAALGPASIQDRLDRHAQLLKDLIRTLRDAPSDDAHLH